MVEGGGGEPMSLGSVLTDSLKGGTGEPGSLPSLSGRSASSSASGPGSLVPGGAGGVRASGLDEGGGTVARASSKDGGGGSLGSTGSYGSSGYGSVGGGKSGAEGGSAPHMDGYGKNRRRTRKGRHKERKDVIDAANRRVKTGVSVPRLVGLNTCNDLLNITQIECL